jgi:hypothetical protein
VAKRLAATGEPTLIVTTPDGDPPLRWYLPGVRPGPGAAPARVALVASWRFGRPRPATPAPPGLTLERRTELPTATLIEFRGTPQGDPAALALDASEAPFVLFSPGA